MATTARRWWYARRYGPGGVPGSQRATFPASAGMARKRIENPVVGQFQTDPRLSFGTVPTSLKFCSGTAPGMAHR